MGHGDRILIVKLSSMGDVIHTLPAAIAIRRAYPDAMLGWAVERRHAEIVRHQPFLDEVIEWDRRTMRTFRQFITRLRRGRWEVAIDFQGLLRSALVARLSGARRRIGYRPGRELAHWTYTQTIPLETMDRHAVERYLDLAGALSEVRTEPRLDRPYLHAAPPAAGPAADNRFPLAPTEDDLRAVDAFLSECGSDPATDRIVALAPECRREANIWPVEKFAEVARRLLGQPGVRVVLCGGASAAKLGDQIAAGSSKHLWRAEGRFGLLGSVELLRRAQVAVTGDTGVLHMAVAAAARVVALFGAANPVRTGPYCERAIVLSRQLECSPCFARRCPLNYDPPRCMDEISVDAVYRAVMRQLEAASCDHQQRPNRKTA